MASLQNKRVLIIDDMKDVRLLVRTILETDGAEVFEAESVDEGIETATNRTPQLIITDLQMPGKNGFDFLKEMKNHEFLSRIPVIVLSGLNDKGSVMAAIDSGAKDYVIKPIKATFLLQKVRKSLNSTEFLTYQFDENSRPLVSAVIPAEIIGANEVGLQLESFVKFNPNSSVKVVGEFMDRIGCKDTLTRTSKVHSTYNTQDRYLTNLNFVGLSTDHSKAIRAKIAEWK